MCLIIANPKCKPVPVEHIENAFSTNSHGFGMMWHNPVRGLRIQRGMFNLAHIKNMFATLESMNVPYVAHFRFATHGTRNTDNCHPFVVGDYLGGVGMVHNGTLTGSEWRDSQRSDTALLVEKIKGHIAEGEFGPKALFDKQAPQIVDRYGKSIGSDKLVFMNGLGDINIVNEGNGTWLDDRWYSNTYSITSWSSWGSWGDDDDLSYSKWFAAGS